MHTKIAYSYVNIEKKMYFFLLEVYTKDPRLKFHLESDLLCLNFRLTLIISGGKSNLIVSPKPGNSLHSTKEKEKNKKIEV